MPRVYNPEGSPLDANFALELGAKSFDLIYKSRGGKKGSTAARNTDYIPGLELLLERLKKIGAVLTQAIVDSAKTRNIEDKQIPIAPQSYPVHLGSLNSVVDFRRTLSSGQASVGQTPDAKGGNPTKRIRLTLTYGNLAAKNVEQFLSKGRGRRFWALLANPKYYRIKEAIASLEVDNWGIAKADVHKGDSVLIWKAKGNHAERGIVAFGEVISEPEEMMDDENPYWVPGVKHEKKRRVQVRYQNAPHLPLWMSSNEKELSKLSVARAKGGSVFNLTEEQWDSIVGLAGGISFVSEEAAELLAVISPNRNGGGQGRRMNYEDRRAIELHAMEAARKHFSKKWDEIIDVSANHSFDLLCRNGNEELRVEVKGTTTEGCSVLLTPNEVRHAKEQYPNVALFVLSEIVFDGTPSGGQVTIFQPWDIRNNELVPTGFECKLDSN